MPEVKSHVVPLDSLASDLGLNEKSPLEVGLPDPGDFPLRDVVVWDGQCVFCRRSVGMLRAFDWTNRLAYLSLHDLRTGQRYPQLTYEQMMDQMWVVTATGDRYGGADAIRYLSRHLPVLWPAAPILHLPFSLPLWRSLYRSIAQRRYRLAGRHCEGGTCDLHRR